MTTPDPTAVRAAAEFRRDYLKDRQLSAVAWQTRGDSILADSYLALTDPTPLTVEVLVGMGFVETIKGRRYHHGRLCCDPAKWKWWLFDGEFASNLFSLPPRTAGELAMLLAMMEGR